MLPKYGKKQTHAANCITDVLTTLQSLVWFINKQTHDNIESICFIKQGSKLSVMVTSYMCINPPIAQKLKPFLIHI